MSDQKDPSPNVRFKDQMREGNAVVDSPPRSTDPRRLSKPSVDPPAARGRAGPTYKDQVFQHPRGVVVVVGPDGEKREVQGRADSSPSVRQNHHHQQQQRQPGAQRVGGGTLSLVAAELVDGDVERQRLEADLRPVIENEVLANLRANLPVAVVAEEEDSRHRSHNNKKAILVTVVAVVLSVVLIVTAIVLGVVIPQRRLNDNTAPSTPTLLLPPSTVPPTPAPTRTRFFLSQVGSDIADFPSSTGCLATSSDCTVIAGCTRAVALAPDKNGAASSWNQLGAVWQDASFVRSAALSGDGTLLALGKFDGVQVFRFEQQQQQQQHQGTAAWINVTDVLTDTIDDDSDFGYAVAFSKDGSFLAVGAPAIDQIRQMGRVTVYENTDGVFTRNGNVLGGLEELDHFGQNLAVSANGAVLAVAAPQDNSGQRDSVQHGYVRTFQYDNGRYIPLAQQLFGAIPSDTASSGFGAALALSSDGRILAAGGRGNNLNDDIYNAGHVRVFNFTSSNGWERLGQDLTGETVFAEFGTAVALSADGLLLGVGAPGGVNAAGNETGLVRLYRYDSDSDQWSQIGSDIHGYLDEDKMGAAVALSDDGMTVVAAAEQYVRVFAIAPL
jgi:hypothetical protein